MFSAKGRFQVFISLLIFILNGIWLLCVSAILFASVGSKLMKGLDWIGRHVSGRSKGADLELSNVALPEITLEMRAVDHSTRNAVLHEGWSNDKRERIMRRQGDQEGGDTLVLNPLMVKKERSRKW